MGVVVEKVIVWPRQKLEIRWKFKKRQKVGVCGSIQFFQFRTMQRNFFVLEYLM